MTRLVTQDPRGKARTGLRAILWPGALLCMAGLISACGLIDPDITEFRFVTEDKEFTIDTGNWGLSGEGKFPRIPCDPANDQCIAASMAYCTSGENAECTASCTPANSCQVTVLASLDSEIKLSEENEFQSINNQPLARVSVESVEYQIVENTLEVPSPVLDIFVGPLGTTAPSQLDARPIGSVDSVEARTKKSWTAIEFTAQGRDALRTLMEGEEYKSPFNVIISTRLDIVEKDPIPSGHVRVGVRITASARPGF
ncbi:MAG: hypothetical protein MJE77_01260 [Proteobacteria bacterium]|nr:hypothetical protein [Pseudomonadota bacterium]